MADLNEQLQEVIRENLPAQVGDEMRKYLEQAKKDKVMLGEAEQSLKHRMREMDLMVKERDDLKGKLNLKEPVKAQASENYLAVIEDADGVTHYWLPNGMYDGYCRPCKKVVLATHQERPEDNGMRVGEIEEPS